jgi:predicted dehydrogenase
MKIVCVGAGGIMRNAHLPAYRMFGFEVAGITDTRFEAAELLGVEFGIPLVSPSVSDLVGEMGSQGVVYDLATPASALVSILDELPDGAFVLMQKPMGETLEQAEEIVAICDRKGMRAAVNFQLRWAPYVLELKRLISEGKLGSITDVEFKVNVFTPWGLWDFLERAPRMEMVYHSIHYIDLVRDLLGEPEDIWARSIKHPDAPKLESSRSFVYCEYGELLRATILTFHAHPGGTKHQESYLKVEGTEGVAKLQMGLNLNYPDGGDDYLEVWTKETGAWNLEPFEGSWFPHAYRGPMTAMMEWARGGVAPSTEIHQSLKTMRLVDTAYRRSDEFGRK